MKNIMSLRSYSNPFSVFDELDKEFGEIFSLGPSKFLSPIGNEQLIKMPRCHFSNKDSHYVLSVDLPGLKKEDVNIEAHDGQIILRGERRGSVNKGDYVERSYGQFERSFSLPKDAQMENIEASFENGVLSLAIPKVEEAKPKKILIEDGRKSHLWERLLGSKSEVKEESL